ncbi:MAG: phosphate ABC transporter permease subunit PstC [Alphaproteobacteria bacterium]|jgi:phosphate transport system permease protein
MQFAIVILALLTLSYGGFLMGRHKAIASTAGNVRDLHSLSSYYGLYVAIWCGIPAFFALMIWGALEPAIISKIVVASLPADQQALSAARLNLLINDIVNLASGDFIGQDLSTETKLAADYYKSLQSSASILMAVLIAALSIAGLVLAKRRISPDFRARNMVEKWIMAMLIAASAIAVLVTVGIVLSLLFESLRFFQKVSFTEFLFGIEWSPQIALRADQVASDGAFGAVPIFAGTALISAIALLIAVPVGLFSAIYLSEYASAPFRAVAKPLLEILAGIPTVVYGFFAALTVAPLLRDTGIEFGLIISSESALAAGLVMGVMIIPFVSSLSDDVITAVPGSLREGSYALGATQSETIKKVILLAALPGIVGSVLLAASRAIGETMIVVMAAGLAANLTANPFQAVTTVTVQIVTLLTGDQEFDSAKTLAAFALGLTLFLVTLCLNVVALKVVQKYRAKYD